MNQSKYFYQKGSDISEISFSSYEVLKDSYIKNFGEAFVTQIENGIIIHENGNIRRCFTNEVSLKESAGVQLFEALDDLINTQIYTVSNPMRLDISKAREAIKKAKGK